jgi:hypothetical protein
LSASDATVAPVPPAALVTSAIETAGDSPTNVSFALLPNASCPEAFLPLSDIVGALCTHAKDLNKTKAYELRQEVGLLTYLVTDLRPGLQGLRGAFIALLCDPRSPTVSTLDLGTLELMKSGGASPPPIFLTTPPCEVSP